MIFKLFRLLKHEHNHAFYGISRCGRQYTDIKSSISNPSFWHYPNIHEMQDWIDHGYTHAYVYLSHWKCTCGDAKSFFFIYDPFKLYAGYTRVSVNEPKWVFDDDTLEAIRNSNPLASGSGRSMTFNEFSKKYGLTLSAT